MFIAPAPRILYYRLQASTINGCCLSPAPDRTSASAVLRAGVLPAGRTAELAWDSWERPAVYDWLSEQGVSEEEQRKVFNVGIGMCAVVPASDAAAGLVIGRVV